MWNRLTLCFVGTVKQSKPRWALAITTDKNVHRRKAWPPLLHRVVRTIRSRDLLRRGQHVLVAVSGGPDSVALLSLLHHLRDSWSLTLTAIHCNYGLRGSESDGDQQFVETFCRERGIPLYVRKIVLQDRPPRTSVQALARDLRYQAFTEVAQQCGAHRIAVGHTADDQAETVLLWILRGAGLTGLSGMPACRESYVVRPLYDTRRQEILAYLEHTRLSFREDSSNSQSRYLRNRIRHELLPVLQQLAPTSVEALCRLADLCREDDRYLDRHIAMLCSVNETYLPDGGWIFQQAVFRGFSKAVQRRILRALLRQSDPLDRSPSLRMVESVIQRVSEDKWDSRIPLLGGWLVVEQHNIRFVPSSTGTAGRDTCPEMPSQTLSIPGSVVWPGTGQLIQVQTWATNQHGQTLGKDYIVVDAQLLSQPWQLRSWLPGDRFYPFGMGGHSKKLQDFFTDQQMPAETRRRVPLLVAPEGIVWVVGYRQDHRWVPTTSTDRCLVVTVEGLEFGEGRG